LYFLSKWHKAERNGGAYENACCLVHRGVAAAGDDAIKTAGKGLFGKDLHVPRGFASLYPEKALGSAEDLSHGRVDKVCPVSPSGRRIDYEKRLHY